jgi:hypothetical protein
MCMTSTAETEQENSKNIRTSGKWDFFSILTIFSIHKIKFDWKTLQTWSEKVSIRPKNNWIWPKTCFGIKWFRAMRRSRTLPMHPDSEPDQIGGSLKTNPKMTIKYDINYFNYFNLSDLQGWKLLLSFLILLTCNHKNFQIIILEWVVAVCPWHTKSLKIVAVKTY